MHKNIYIYIFWTSHNKHFYESSFLEGVLTSFYGSLFSRMENIWKFSSNYSHLSATGQDNLFELTKYSN